MHVTGRRRRWGFACSLAGVALCVFRFCSQLSFLSLLEPSALFPSRSPTWSDAEKSGAADRNVRIQCRARPAFFDTSGRLQRGPPPKDAVDRLYVPVYNGLSLVRPASPEGFEPIILSTTQAAKYTSQEGCLEVWLGNATEGALGASAEEAASTAGTYDGFWLLDLSHLAEPPSMSDLGLPEDGQWAKLRDRAGPSVCDALADDDYGALLANARGLSLWHQSVTFCAQCGGSTVSFREGRNRKCTKCGARFRPRVDPSVIVLVAKGRRCLLGRQAAWPKGRYSTLAGFVEFGETFEESLVREVYEESGVKVLRDSIRFVASQPWLFPRSLMVGYIAEAENEVLNVDYNELQDAAWFDADEVRASLQVEDGGGENGLFHVPSKVSLARRIIETWLEELDGKPVH
eukprot:TRINITY_DN42245_c0_g1_i1.p1 TRINITY_DN42245_c0_g1~~TRINITY_DN42245_c0_g1_i1.p1  ORF type:complete len:403 (-),score=39.82 TRINITY_DN42245_c0_g1_i1:212-1420(-)